MRRMPAPERSFVSPIFLSVLLLVCAVGLMLFWRTRPEGIGMSLDGPRDVLWFEDFVPCEDGCVNGGLRKASWSFQIGNGADFGIPGWGNNEQECYRSNPENVRVVPKPGNPEADGILQITALRSSKPFSCSNSVAPPTGSSYHWSSGKLVTMGKQDHVWQGTPQRYRPLYVEAYMKLPVPGQGLWPAFWMMPTPLDPARCLAQLGAACDGAYGGWPRSGEMDIMEAVSSMSPTHSAVHFMGTWGGHTQKGHESRTTDGSQRYHVYGVKWTPHYLSFFVDDANQPHIVIPAAEFNAAYAPNPTSPFDKPFYVLLNLAVGGAWPGQPDHSTPSTATLEVDWVRVSLGPEESPPGAASAALHHAGMAAASHV